MPAPGEAQSLLLIPVPSGFALGMSQEPSVPKSLGTGNSFLRVSLDRQPYNTSSGIFRYRRPFPSGSGSRPPRRLTCSA